MRNQKNVIGVASSLDSGRVGEFTIKIFQNNVKTLIELINIRTLLENIVRGDMGNPNFRSNGEKGKISGLSGHANLLDSFE